MIDHGSQEGSHHLFPLVPEEAVLDKDLLLHRILCFPIIMKITLESTVFFFFFLLIKDSKG